MANEEIDLLAEVTPSPLTSGTMGYIMGYIPGASLQRVSTGRSGDNARYWNFET